jgi:hypothetical protein
MLVGFDLPGGRLPIENGKLEVHEDKSGRSERAFRPRKPT